MSNPLIQIGNEVREMTDDERAEYDAHSTQIEAQIQSVKDRLALRAAVFAKLGLTADEAAALLG